MTKQVESSGGLSLQLLYKMLLDTARGLYYMHTNPPFAVIHCDVKECNILVFCSDDDRLSSVKIGGFSCAQVQWQVLNRLHCLKTAYE